MKRRRTMSWKRELIIKGSSIIDSLDIRNSQLMEVTYQIVLTKETKGHNIRCRTGI